MSTSCSPTVALSKRSCSAIYSWLVVLYSRCRSRHLSVVGRSIYPSIAALSPLYEPRCHLRCGRAIPPRKSRYYTCPYSPPLLRFYTLTSRTKSIFCSSNIISSGQNSTADDEYLLLTTITHGERCTLMRTTWIYECGCTSVYKPR